MKKISISDVAKQAGVSKATVSLVLNNKESGIRISEKTRLKVLQAAKDLNYHPNYGARLLSTGRSCVIGVLTVNENMLFVSDYDGRIMRGISAVAHESGYNIMILDEGIINKKTPLGGNLIYGRFLDGILIIGPDFKSKNLIKTIHEIHQNNIPFVYVWRKSADRDAPVVLLDNIQAAQMGVEYLISLGHRRIGYVSLGKDSLSGWERLEGYKRALEKHGLRYDETLVRDDIKISDGASLVNEKNLDKLLNLSNPPTALFVAFDPLAIAILNSLHKRGISVPDDISILGFGNTTMTSFSSPQLTTINEPLEEIGKHSAKLLLNQIVQKNSGDNHKRIVVQTKLIERDSCRTL
ncbi:MAG: LacI family transcriptional regulator [Calditrichaeota bacterium]|nr:LacI family transcriptional regulator [Calditrichota bacterium]